MPHLKSDKKLASGLNCAKTRSPEPECTLVDEDSSTESTKYFKAEAKRSYDLKTSHKYNKPSDSTTRKILVRASISQNYKGAREAKINSILKEIDLLRKNVAHIKQLIQATNEQLSILQKQFQPYEHLFSTLDGLFAERNRLKNLLSVSENESYLYSYAKKIFGFDNPRNRLIIIQIEINAIQEKINSQPIINQTKEEIERCFLALGQHNESLSKSQAKLKDTNKLLDEVILITLSEEEKGNLIAKLISGDHAAIKILTSIFEIANKTFDEIDGLFENPKNDELLNSKVKEIINICLDGVNRDAKQRILQMAFQNIPESVISIPKKFAIAKDFDVLYIPDLAYHEPLEPLVNPRSNKVITSEDLLYLENKAIEISEAIIIITAYYNIVLDDPDSQKVLNDIQHDYLKTDYEECKNNILKLSEKLSSKVRATIVAIMQNADEVDLEENHARRFFENRLSQFYMGREADFESINRLTTRLLQMQVQTLGDVERAVLQLPELDCHAALESYQDLKRNSLIYRWKDRILKEGFISKEEESYKVSKEIVGSRNSGLLKSFSPNFFDETTSTSLNNRIVDVNTHSEEFFSYSLGKERSAFASSLSGHAYYIAAILEIYMSLFKSDPNLNKDINDFIKTYIAAYISRGYHSYLEVADVFNEHNTQKFFNFYKVKLDLDYNNEILERAFFDSAEYALMLCKKRAVNLEIEEVKYINAQSYFKK